MACIAEAMGARDAGKAIFEFLAQVGLPTSLAGIGFDRNSLDRAAQVTVETAKVIILDLLLSRRFVQF
jgi:alcohol dehydrogenase class IV